jgi:hypothetical protein
MKRLAPLLILAACLALLLAGMFRLFELRFNAGDVYPPYSSLRADPLGVMALYESLDRLPGMTVQRDLSSANRLPEGKTTAYLNLAANPWEFDFFSDEDAGEIEQFLHSGGRLVITLFPLNSSSEMRHGFDFEQETNPVPKSKSDPEKKSAPAKKTSPKRRRMHGLDEKQVQTVGLRERWGMDFALVPLDPGTNDAYAPAIVTNRSSLTLPAELEWHSSLVLSNLAPAWQIIYTRGARPVVAERRFGAGSVVVATDSFFVSNEALAKNRHADFLAWLLGPVRKIYFDEAHLGVVQEPGIAGLMRKYRLHGFAAGLIVLAALFIWKSSASLAPKIGGAPATEAVAGRDAASGFVNLLRRNIPPRTVMATAFDEWKKTARQSGRYSTARLRRAEEAFAAAQALSPAEASRTYNEIAALLSTKDPQPENRNPAP